MCAPVAVLAVTPLLRALASEDFVPLASGLNASGSAYVDVAVRGLPSLQELTARVGQLQVAMEGQAVVELKVCIDGASTQRDWLVLQLSVEALIKSAQVQALLNAIATAYNPAGRVPRLRRA